MQNDYRDMYNEEAWKNITDDGKNVKDINTIASFSNFYNSNSVENYIISKHEISEWIRKNGFDALINIMQKINQGKKFNNLYFN